MNLTITQSNKHYVLTTESGPILRIFNEKNLVWNLKHVFGLKAADVKWMKQQLAVTPSVSFHIEVAA
jgi:hypothetical protein